MTAEVPADIFWGVSFTALLPVMAGGKVGKGLERNNLEKKASYVTDTDAISQSFSTSSALLILHSPKRSEEWRVHPIMRLLTRKINVAHV